jgi:hypothetical protein
LTPAELASLLPQRQQVTAAQYAVAELAWRAFRHDTPLPLDALLRTDTSALPFLGAALERFLQDYPWTSDGLSRTERRLLQLASAGPVEMTSLFPRMHEGETAYYVTDTSLADLVGRLSGMSPPLLTSTPDGAVARVLQGAVIITEAGLRVLSGRDWTATTPVDRWYGGVHLEAGRDGWRWDDAHGRITRMPSSPSGTG